jgi:pre-mRNA-splicing factor SYF2
VEEYKSLTPREKKILELRKKLKQCRNENRKAVVEEDSRQHDPQAEAKRRRLEYYEQQAAARREMEEKGGNFEKKKLLNTTAEDALNSLKKKEKKTRTESTFGWEKFGLDAQYNAYKKRQKDNHFSQEEYEKKKAEAEAKGKDFYRDSDYLSYGQDSEPLPRDKLYIMRKELGQVFERRKNFSRRRPHLEDEDVSYINERNRKFNKKLSRAYDPYTAEIKQNLERGTAL